MRPADVLDLQRITADALSSGHAAELAVNAAASFLAQARRANGLDVRTSEEHGARLIASIPPALRAAGTFHVQAHMTDLIVAAADGLDDLMPFRRDFLPTGVGFVYLDKPLRFLDIRGRTMKIHALLWSPVTTSSGEPGIGVIEFTDINDPDATTTELVAMYGPDLVRSYGRLQIANVSIIAHEQRMGPPRHEPNTFEQAIAYEEGDTPTASTNTHRLFTALVRLMQQTLVLSEPATLDRHAKRRAQRAGLPARVTVVKLRRQTPREGGQHQPVEWQHHWIVRGHWRRQPVGPNYPHAEPDGQGGHVAILWIAPHVKGNLDAPLLQTEKVYDLTR